MRSRSLLATSQEYAKLTLWAVLFQLALPQHLCAGTGQDGTLRREHGPLSLVRARGVCLHGIGLERIIRREAGMQHANWKCQKCDNREFEKGQFAATGGGVSRFFNVQNKKFTTVTCTQCKYTEIYMTDTSTLANVFDFLGG